MSLINRMLQDLDARGNESAGKGAMYAQIRSVPESRSRHPARWIGLAVAIGLLIGILAWQWMSHSVKPVDVVEPAVQTSLLGGLKLSSDLSLDQLAAENSLSQSQIGESSNSDAVADVSAPAVPLETKQAGLVDNEKASFNASALASVESVPKVAASAPMPVIDRSLASSKKITNAAPISVDKQVNELTVQQRAENEYRKAVLLIQQKRPAEAIWGLEQALQLDPQHVAARQALVGLLIDAKRQDEGIRKLQDGLTLDITQQGLAKILARLQVEKGELRQAIDTLQRTLPYAIDRSDYQAFLAALLQRDGHHKEAIEHYLLALHNTPQNGVWWMGLGISLQAENRLMEAQGAFSQAKTSNVLSPELQAFVDQKLKQLKQLKH